jgi:cell wall-associated NlpC family hydrolase
MKQLVLLCGWLCLAPLTGLAMPAADASSTRTGPLAHALDALGTRYSPGGRSPETGFDCSGLIAYVFEQAWGVPLPHNALAQSRIGAPVNRRHLAPGDLVFYNTRDQPFSHVGMYIGNGRFIHAPKPGARVRLESIDSPYWRARFNGGRRLDIAKYSH